jgi:hypothetical protein
MFQDARLKLESVRPLQPTEDEVECEKCPMGCNEVKGSMHFLHCSKQQVIIARTKMIRNVLRRLKALRTYEGITSMVGKILDDISRRKPITIEYSNNARDGDMSMNQAMIGQEEIGWHKFCQGYCHLGWSQLQKRHYKCHSMNSKALSIERWKIMFTTILVEYSMDCWKQRNEYLHGKEVDESRQIRQKRIIKTMKELYKKRIEMRGTKYYRFFKMALKKHLKLGLQANTIWISVAEEALWLHRKSMRQNTLNSWLTPIR